MLQVVYYFANNCKPFHKQLPTIPQTSYKQSTFDELGLWFLCFSLNYAPYTVTSVVRKKSGQWLSMMTSFWETVSFLPLLYFFFSWRNLQWETDLSASAGALLPDSVSPQGKGSLHQVYAGVIPKVLPFRQRHSISDLLYFHCYQKMPDVFRVLLNISNLIFLHQPTWTVFTLCLSCSCSVWEQII